MRPAFVSSSKPCPSDPPPGTTSRARTAWTRFQNRTRRRGDVASSAFPPPRSTRKALICGHVAKAVDAHGVTLILHLADVARAAVQADHLEMFDAFNRRNERHADRKTVRIAGSAGGIRQQPVSFDVLEEGPHLKRAVAGGALHFHLAHTIDRKQLTTLGQVIERRAFAVRQSVVPFRRWRRRQRRRGCQLGFAGAGRQTSRRSVLS